MEIPDKKEVAEEEGGNEDCENGALLKLNMFLDQSSTAAPEIYVHPLSDCCLSSLLSFSW